MIDRLLNNLARRLAPLLADRLGLNDLGTLARRLAPLLAERLTKFTEPKSIVGDHPEATVGVHSLYLTEGMTLTVFAGAFRRTDGDPLYHQIELRTAPGGKVELFADPGVAVHAWDEWTPGAAEGGDIRKAVTR